MPLDPSHPDYWTEVFQFTSKYHRDVYPSINPSQARIQDIARNKVVLVTGAGSGFGEGACQQWAKAGAKAIILAARSQDRILAVASALESAAPNVQTLAVATDVSSETDVDSLFEKTIDKFGTIDVVVHAAGVLGPVANIGDAPVDAWWQAFEINTKGTFLVARALAKISDGKEATFIQTGTVASYFANTEQSPYTASKAASNMLMDQLQAEYKNLRVFNVHPGMAKSAVLRSFLEVYAKDTPELFGSVTVYLAGKQADFLRGCFISSNWDVDELEKHQDEIVAQGLLKGQPCKGNFGPGGHRFEGS